MIRKKMKIVLRTRDEKTLEVDTEDVQESVLMSTLLESDVQENEEIPIPNVDFNILTRIISFLRLHRDSPMKRLEKPLSIKPFSEIVEPWVYSFITGFDSIEELYELIKAADYMDIQPLHELACARVASMIRGKNPIEIRRILGLSEE